MTLADLRKTFRDAWRNSIDDPDDALDAGVAAVLRKHIEPMIDAAYEAGVEFALSNKRKGPTGRSYAVRIIATLTTDRPGRKGTGE